MTRSLPKAALLDLDGTIIDALEPPEFAWRAVCDEAAQAVQVASVDLYTAIDTARFAFWTDQGRIPVGPYDLRAVVREIVSDALGALCVGPGLADPITDAYRARRIKWAAIPGALETVQALHAEGVQLALLTNGPPDLQRPKIDQLDLESLFDCILIGGELGFGKPDERIFRIALEALKTQPGDAWMVGDDQLVDVAGAQRLGIHAIWVESSNQGAALQPRIRPDRVISSLPELLFE